MYVNHSELYAVILEGYCLHDNDIRSTQNEPATVWHSSALVRFSLRPVGRPQWEQHAGVDSSTLR